MLSGRGISVESCVKCVRGEKEIESRCSSWCKRQGVVHEHRGVQPAMLTCDAKSAAPAVAPAGRASAPLHGRLSPWQCAPLPPPSAWGRGMHRGKKWINKQGVEQSLSRWKTKNQPPARGEMLSVLEWRAQGVGKRGGRTNGEKTSRMESDDGTKTERHSDPHLHWHPNTLICTATLSLGRCSFLQ